MENVEAKQLKILLLTHGWVPENGVPQRRWLWLTKVLRRQGIDVDVISTSRQVDIAPFRSETDSSVVSSRSSKWNRGEQGEWVRIPRVFNLGDSLTARALGQVLDGVSQLGAALSEYGLRKSAKPDLIVGTVPVLPTAFTTWLVARLLHRPYVIDLRDAWPDLLEVPEKWNSSVGVPSFRERLFTLAPFKAGLAVGARALWRILEKADGVIVTSEAHRQHLLEKWAKCPDGVWSKSQKDCRNKGFRSSQEWSEKHIQRRIEVVRNVFASGFSLLHKTKEPRPGDSLRVLYAGTVGRAQDIQNALRAAAIVQKQGGTVNMRIVGRGAAWNACVELAEQLGLQSVEFIPHVSTTELLQHYEWADTALVHLTDWDPLDLAIPSKTYELMSAKIPITAVGRGALVELVNRFGAGICVEPNNPEKLSNAWLNMIRTGKHTIAKPSNEEWDIKTARHDAEIKLTRLIRTIAFDRKK